MKNSLQQNEIFYENAPIIEALVEIQVEHSIPLVPSLYEDLYDKLKGDYPEKTQNLIAQIDISANDTEAPSVTTKNVNAEGFRCLSADKSQVIRITKTGIIFSKLKPYTEWSLFIEEARKVWDIYSSIFKPVKSSKLELRYINQFSCPIVDFSNYLKMKPLIPESNPSFFLSGFSQKFLITYPDINVQGIINTIVQPNKDTSNILTIVLDIDVFKIVSINAEWSNIYSELISLRKVKNALFASNIGDKAKIDFRRVECPAS